jgi:hypothetical protein
MSRISPSRAAALQAEVTKLKKNVEGVCGVLECTPGQESTVQGAAASLADADRDYGNAAVLARERNRLFASAGVSFSACAMQKDLTRRGAIGVTFRKMDTYGARKEQFAGGNTISLSTLTPMASWRPLFDVASGKYDYVDLATGAGVYWLASDGNLPGGFDAFSGVILEPIRVDLHAPSLSHRTGWKWGLFAAASLRGGLAIFPAGFKPNAFGVTREPAQSQRIRGEWVPFWAIYFDVSRFLYYATKANQ